MKTAPDTTTFRFYNANPKNRRTGDCVIRAVAEAAGMTWEQALRGLTETAAKTFRSPTDTETYDEFLRGLGFIKHKQPRKDNGKKYTGNDFCTWLSVNDPCGMTGNVVANIGGHHVVCISPTNDGDGINCRFKVLDTWNSTGGCIGNYWTRNAQNPFNAAAENWRQFR